MEENIKLKYVIDASYVALAKQENVRLLTFDERLKKLTEL